MNSYEINEDTLAIIPKNINKTIIYERYRNYIINQEVDKIMEDSCRYYGSSLKGRQIGSTSLIDITHKVPIIIEETNNLIFFPTSSPRLNTCSWISLNNIEKYEKDNKGCKIYFKDGKTVVLPVSYSIINNQILRSSRLQMMLDKRKEQKKVKNSKNNDNFVI